MKWTYIDPGSHIEYYQGRQQWNGPQDHVVKLQAPPNAGGWGAPQSGEHSSNYSGSHPTPRGQHPTNMSLGYNQSQFSYEDLASATNGFSDANLIGQGGFGYVHKGVLPNGQEVAVKSLKTGSGQGEREFQAEVEIISRVHHRHLVSLVGYSIADTQRMLVYEFVPNKTLEYHLYSKLVCTVIKSCKSIWPFHHFLFQLRMFICIGLKSTKLQNIIMLSCPSLVIGRNSPIILYHWLWLCAGIHKFLCNIFKT